MACHAVAPQDEDRQPADQGRARRRRPEWEDYAHDMERVRVPGGWIFVYGKTAPMFVPLTKGRCYDCADEPEVCPGCGARR